MSYLSFSFIVPSSFFSHRSTLPYLSQKPQIKRTARPMNWDKIARRPDKEVKSLVDGVLSCSPHAPECRWPSQQPPGSAAPAAAPHAHPSAVGFRCSPQPLGSAAALLGRRRHWVPLLPLLLFLAHGGVSPSVAAATGFRWCC